MKQVFLTLIMILVIASGADACVGKVLTIGAMNAAPDRVLAEMFSVLITERTGTAVTIRYFTDAQELYGAVEKNEISILIENTDRGLARLGWPTDAKGEKAYGILKEEFRRRYRLVCLQPSGFISPAEGADRNIYTPVVTVDVMNNFPALPRVINKLAGVMNDAGYLKLAASVESGEQPQKAARAFLKSRKFI